jgi:Tfp pilus assembly protein PilE
VEVSIALVVVVLLATMGMPIYQRAMEQARVDMAGAQLRSIYAAQRVYYLEHKSFAHDLQTLRRSDLIEQSLVEGSSAFVFQFTGAAGESFTATATRRNSSVWTGSLEITESGVLTGCIAGRNPPALLPNP